MVDTDYDDAGLWPSVTDRGMKTPYGLLPDYVCQACAEATHPELLAAWGYDPDFEELPA